MGTSLSISELNRLVNAQDGQLEVLPHLQKFADAVKQVENLVPWPHIDFEWEVVAAGNDLHLHGVIAPTRHLMLTFPSPFTNFTVSLFSSEGDVIRTDKPLAVETAGANDTDLLGALSLVVGTHLKTAWQDRIWFSPFKTALATTFRCCLLDAFVEIRPETVLWESPSGKTAFIQPAAPGLVIVNPGTKGVKLVLAGLWVHPPDNAIKKAKGLKKIIPSGLALPFPPEDGR